MELQFLGLQNFPYGGLFYCQRIASKLQAAEKVPHVCWALVRCLKPHFQTFMQPFANSLNDLFFKGIDVKLNGKNMLLRCILLLGTFDAPAKCLFQEFCQFNAFYGCPYCLSPGKTVQTSSKGHTHAYPFDEANLRTAIDYMHSTLLGVVKMLLTLWSDKTYKAEPWSVCKRMKEIEERYLKISPPSCITRLPRSLIANFGHLKASEVLSALPSPLEAIYLLLQDSISPNDIVKASALIKHFCIRIKELYAARYETFNVHCLLHMTERVRDLGPLWTHSCFCFEDFNGELRSLFHGTQSVEEQIVTAVSVQQRIPELVPLLESNSNCSIVGNLQNYVFTAVERAVVESLIGPVQEVYQFFRLLIESN
ncbi:unnamed protein product [Porites lobata]|uniref:Uncharacterized protein n=1 Tax=Porites lobata TaxID=104759 RepID=A0ABN8Q751_9CNID|nr:unnamed protein product [Porites lobata]